MFFGADAFLRLLAAYRVVWLSGRFGGGKTSLGVWLAAWLTANKYAANIVSNIDISGRAFPVPVPLKDSAIMLDEAWMYVDTWNDVKSYAAFLRKMNLYLIMPSVWPPHPRLRILEVHRIFNGRVVGLPFWVYRWSLSMASIGEKGFFALFYPERCFQFYDTEYIPKDDGGIVAAMASTIGELPESDGDKRGRKRRSGRQTAAASAGGIGSVEEVARRLDDAAERLEVVRRYSSGKRR